MESPAPMLRCDGLWKVFGRSAADVVGSDLAGLAPDRLLAETGCVAAVRDVSLSVAPGELFVIMGRSGSGKSTLVRCLGRLLDPTAGRISVAGEDITDHGPTALRALRRDVISMVFQHFGLLPNRRVLDNVAYGLEIQGVDRARRHARAAEMIDLVGLSGFADHYPDALSGGMQQRVGLARALANDPKVLLLDEPLSALDPLTRRDMQDEILELQHRIGTTMVFITHDLSEALRLGDRIAVMRDGAIVQVGTGAELLTRPADAYVRDFTRDAPRGLVLTARDLCALHLDPDRAEDDVDPSDHAAAELREVPAGTTLQDLIPAVVDGSRVRVVDDGRVLGTVTRNAVLAALSGRPLDDGERSGDGRGGVG
jgi:glycine betaine/proline transport system ATP-binding protein